MRHGWRLAGYSARDVGGATKFHLLAIPNTHTTAAYPLDGFAQRTILFASLLQRLGHEVSLYGVEENDAPCTEFVSCLKESERVALLGGQPYQTYVPAHDSLLMLTFNTRAADHIRVTKRPDDIIATIAGSASHQIWNANPELRFLEYSIGYRGVTAPYRVYQSQAWRHVVHGFTGIDGGREFDAVIPPWFEACTFPFLDPPEAYVLYCGRLVAPKGLATACRAADAAGVRLVVIGHGDASLVTSGEYLGEVSTAERNRLMAGARAVLMPTQYLEPFGNVAAEAQLCGTPVISTDYGAFTESVAHGVSGYRCHTLGEWAQAIDLSRHLDRQAIRQRAVRLYGEDAADTAYRAFFRRLNLIGKDGWEDLALGFEPTAQEEYSYGAFC